MKKRISIIIALFLIYSGSHSAPILPHIIRLIQPNGFKFQAKILGDEHVVYYETLDGYTITKDKLTGYWCVAKLNDAGKLLASPLKITSNSIKQIIPVKKHLRMPFEIYGIHKKFYEKRSNVQRPSIYKLAVLLIDFSDVPHTFQKNNFESLLFSENYVYQSPVSGEPAYGSLHDYFFENSNGKLRVEGDVYNWLRADSIKNYYETKGNLNAEAVSKSGVDLSNYDGFVVIYAGDVGRAGSKLWPETNYVGFSKPHYIMSEKWMPAYKFAPIGVHSHEFGHLLGLPDLYDTDFSSNGIGIWGLMGYGEYGNGHMERPFHLCAWSKKQLGWANEEKLYQKVPKSIALAPVETENHIVKVISKESFFLLENRENVGYDFYLPASGLLIWHIDERYGQQNADNHRLVNLIEADNNEPAFYAGDPFPGSTNNTEFTPTSTPASVDYDGQAYVYLTSISQQNQFIYLTCAVLFGSNKPVHVVSINYDFPNLFTALEISADGDSIFLKKGIYSENNLFIRHALFIGGEDVNFTTIRGKNSTVIFAILNSSNVEISNVQLTDARNGIMWNNSSGSLKNLIFYRLTNDAVRCNASSPTIINNTIVQNGGTGIFCSNGSNVIIMNNILTNNNFGISAYKSSPILLYNDVWNNLVNYNNVDPGTNDISKNPKFADEYYQEYSLLPTSPCIDAGNPDSSYLDPDSTRNDMGALYFHLNQDSHFENLRVNCGGGHYVDSTHQVWYADQTFNGTWGYSGGVSGIIDDSAFVANSHDSLYITYRKDMKRYVFNAGNGYYQIKLHFIEPNYKNVNERVFHITVNGDTIFKNIDPAKDAGYLIPFTKIGYTNVWTHKIVFQFLPVIEQPILSGLEFRKITGGFRKIAGNNQLINLENCSSSAWGDFNNDGSEDVFITCKAKNNFLMKNNGYGLYRIWNSPANLRFTGGGISSAFIDYDNDGYLDLFVINNEGKLLVYKNSNKVFNEVTDSLKLNHLMNVLQIKPIDYDNDNFLDLVVNTSNGLKLFRNENGRFYSDVSSILGITSGLKTTSVLVADFNRDGWSDIFITNHDLFFPQTNLLLLNKSGENFRSNALGHNGNCAEAADFDNDGDLDLVITSNQIGRSRYFRNNLDSWADISRQIPAFSENNYQQILSADWNNDGWTDLWLVTKDGRNKLFLNNNSAGFKEVTDSLGVTNELFGPEVSLSYADNNSDGTLDIFQTVSGSKNNLYENFSTQNNWVGFRLRGSTANAMGLGTKIRLIAGDIQQYREMNLHNSGKSNSTFVMHFGLGQSDKIDTLTVFWTDGHLDSFYNIRGINRYYTLVENTELPVNFISLFGKYEFLQKRIFLKWKVPSLKQFYRFRIEKSYNKRFWMTAADLPATGKEEYFWYDNDINPVFAKYFYRIKGELINSSQILSNKISINILKQLTFELFQNYPNPFNEETLINYQLTQNEPVTLKIYNNLGKMVKKIVDKKQTPGFYTLEWSGKNDSGENVASGLYFLVLKQGNRRQVRKTILLR